MLEDKRVVEFAEFILLTGIPQRVETATDSKKTLKRNNKIYIKLCKERIFINHSKGMSLITLISLSLQNFFGGDMEYQKGSAHLQ